MQIFNIPNIGLNVQESVISIYLLVGLICPTLGFQYLRLQLLHLREQEVPLNEWENEPCLCMNMRIIIIMKVYIKILLRYNIFQTNMSRCGRGAPRKNISLGPNAGKRSLILTKRPTGKKTKHKIERDTTERNAVLVCSRA